MLIAMTQQVVAQIKPEDPWVEVWADLAVANQIYETANPTSYAILAKYAGSHKLIVEPKLFVLLQLTYSVDVGQAYGW